MSSLATQLAADINGGLREEESFFCIDADLFEDQIGKLFHDLAIKQSFVERNEFTALQIAIDTRQLQEELFPGNGFDVRGRDQSEIPSIVEMFAEAIHAFLAGETDRADGETELGSDFAVGARRSFEEK